MHRMASADGEAAWTPADQEHLAACSACQRWAADFAAVNAELQELPYPVSPADAWLPISERIQQGDHPWLSRRLWLIGPLVLGWRAFQLVADFQAPALSLILPALAAIVLWRMGRGLLTIETWAPELHKRGM